MASVSHLWNVPLKLAVSIGDPVLFSAATGRPGAGPAEGLLRRPAVDIFAQVSGCHSLEAFAREGFTWQTALNSALCSYLAYRAPTDVRAMALGQWRFESCEPVAAGGTECFVASTAQSVVVAFRGTQEVADWLTNLNAAWTYSGCGYVHHGFHAAFQSVRAQLEEALNDARASQKRVVLTGHSLGGALATIAAAKWHGVFPVSGVYTFGQPAVGFTTFHSYVEVRYPGCFFRFVNDDDIVPRVPPGYRHVGKLFHFTGAGRLTHERLVSALLSGDALDDTPTMSDLEFESLRARLESARIGGSHAMNESLHSNFMREGLFPSVADHALDRYLEKIVAQFG